MKDDASCDRRSLVKARHSWCDSPPTPLTTRTSASCTFLSSACCSRLRGWTTPSTPLTVPKRRLAGGEVSDESAIVSEPRRKRLMNSPTWNSPTTCQIAVEDASSR
eukprot:3240734-Prymnesium_polylepis.1